MQKKKKEIYVYIQNDGYDFGVSDLHQQLVMDLVR